MQISFDTDNVRVNEDNGTVFVCLVKDRQTLRDIQLNVTARELNSPDARCESSAYEVNCLYLLLYMYYNLSID